MKLATLFFCVCALAATPAAAQIREIPLPFPDTTRFRVQFVDEMNGWVSSMNGNILHTSDGGAHWDLYHTPYPKPVISEIRFSSKDYGILWAYVDENAYDGRLYQTFNAGKDWDRVPMYDSIFFSKKLRLDVYPMAPGYIIWSGGRVWRYGNNAPLRELIASWTTNGGLDWNKSVYPSGYPDVFIPLDTNCWGWFHGALEIPDITPICGFAISTDHGGSWYAKRYWVPMVSMQCEFQDSRRGVVPGGAWEEMHVDSGAYATFDGGETWERWPRYAHRNYSAAFLGDSVVYAIANYFSGKTWEKRIVGTLVRYFRSRMDLGAEYYFDGVTLICNGGSKIFVLMLDGRLFVVENDLVQSATLPVAVETQELTVSPNPARDEIILERKGGLASSGTFEMFDMVGKRVLPEVNLAFQPFESRRNISLSALPAGVYFLAKRGERSPIRRFSLIR